MELRNRSTIILIYSIVPIILALLSYKTITSLNPLYYIVLLGIIPFFLILINYPEVGLILYTTALGFWDPLCEILGIPAGLRALPVALFLASLLILFAFMKRKNVRLGSIHKVGIGIGILLFIGLKWTSSPNYGLWKTQAFVLYNLLIFIGVTLFVGEKERLKRILYTAALLGIIFSFLGLYVVFSKGLLDWTRLTIIKFDPIWLARGLGAYTLALFIMVEISHSLMKKILFIVFILSLLFLMFNTASRGPTFSIFFTLIFYIAFLLKRPLWKKISLMLIMGIIIYTMFSFVPQKAQARYIDVLNQPSEVVNASVRKQLWQVAMDAFNANPLIGLGTGGYSHYYISRDVRIYPHNLFLEMASEFGIFGLAFIMIFLFLNFKIVFNFLRNNPKISKDNYLLIWGILLFIFGFLNSMVSGDISTNKILWFGSGFMWTSYMTEALGKESENLKSGI